MLDRALFISQNSPHSPHLPKMPMAYLKRWKGGTNWAFNCSNNIKSREKRKLTKGIWGNEEKLKQVCSSMGRNECQRWRVEREREREREKIWCHGEILIKLHWSLGLEINFSRQNKNTNLYHTNKPRVQI